MGNKKNKYCILLFIVIGIIVVLLLTFYYLGKKEEEKSTQTQQVKEETIKPAPSNNITTSTSPIELTPGLTGEPKEKPFSTSSLPLVIFNTTGKIIEVRPDSLIVLGDGSNFADGKPRNLTCIFTDDTLTFNKDQSKSYKGKEGLKYLKKGMEILIDSEENIRGKTKFPVRTINILE